MKKKLLVGLLAVVMCFALTGCGEKKNDSNKENNDEVISKYNDSMKSLLEGYCKVLKGEEKLDTYLSLFPKEMKEARQKIYERKSADGKFSYEKCSYEVESTYTSDEVGTIEKYANEDNNMSLDLKECKNIKMSDGKTRYPDKRACLNSDGKWYLLQE